MRALWCHASFTYHFTKPPSFPGSRIISASLHVKIKAHRGSYGGQSSPPVMGGNMWANALQGLGPRDGTGLRLLVIYKHPSLSLLPVVDLPLAQGFLTVALLTCRTRWLFIVGTRVVCFGIFSSNPGRYPLDASSTIPSSCDNEEMSPDIGRHCKIAPTEEALF